MSPFVYWLLHTYDGHQLLNIVVRIDLNDQRICFKYPMEPDNRAKLQRIFGIKEEIIGIDTRAIFDFREALP